MSPLDTSLRLPDPDAAYNALIDAHRGLSDAESAALNARLILLLANHIGDPAVLAQAIALARSGSERDGGAWFETPPGVAPQDEGGG